MLRSISTYKLRETLLSLNIKIKFSLILHHIRFIYIAFEYQKLIEYDINIEH